MGVWTVCLFIYFSLSIGCLHWIVLSSKCFRSFANSDDWSAMEHGQGGVDIYIQSNSSKFRTKNSTDTSVEPYVCLIFCEYAQLSCQYAQCYNGKKPNGLSVDPFCLLIQAFQIE